MLGEAVRIPPWRDANQSQGLNRVTVNLTLSLRYVEIQSYQEAVWVLKFFQCVFVSFSFTATREFGPK